MKVERLQECGESSIPTSQTRLAKKSHDTLGNAMGFGEHCSSLNSVDGGFQQPLQNPVHIPSNSGGRPFSGNSGSTNMPSKTDLPQRIHHCKQFVPLKPSKAPPPPVSFHPISDPSAPTIDLENDNDGPAFINYITNLVDSIDVQSRAPDTAPIEGEQLCPSITTPRHMSMFFFSYFMFPVHVTSL
jgi:hypothetical protein